MMCFPVLVTSEDEGNLETLSVNVLLLTNKKCLSSWTCPPPPSRKLVCEESWFVCVKSWKKCGKPWKVWKILKKVWKMVSKSSRVPLPAPITSWRKPCIWQFLPKSKQMLGSAGGKSYAYIWWTFDFKPFLFKDHYCKEYEVWVWRHSDNYFYIILIFEWRQVWFLASPFLGKL